MRDRLTQLEANLVSHDERLDNITSRIDVVEDVEGNSDALATIRIDITTLKADMDQMRSTNTLTIEGEVSLPHWTECLCTTMSSCKA